MKSCLLILIISISINQIISKRITEDINKFFKSPIIPKKNDKEPKDRELKNQMKDLIQLLIKPKIKIKKKKYVSLADKLNMLNNFEKEANKIKKKKFYDENGKKIFDKTKRKLLQTLSDRKLDTSICKSIYLKIIFSFT